MERIRRKSADTESMVSELINLINHPEGRENISMLLGKQTTEADKMELAVRILALARVPARTVHGVILKEHGEKVELVHWLEALSKQALDSP